MYPGIERGIPVYHHTNPTWSESKHICCCSWCRSLTHPPLLLIWLIASQIFHSSLKEPYVTVPYNSLIWSELDLDCHCKDIYANSAVSRGSILRLPPSSDVIMLEYWYVNNMRNHNWCLVNWSVLHNIATYNCCGKELWMGNSVTRIGNNVTLDVEYSGEGHCQRRVNNMRNLHWSLIDIVSWHPWQGQKLWMQKTLTERGYKN